MTENNESPELPEIHDVIARIGQHLATSTNDGRPWAHTGSRLTFGPEWSNHWHGRHADLLAAIQSARWALFGRAPLSKQHGVSYAPSFARTEGSGINDEDQALPAVQFFDNEYVAAHPFWRDFVPGLEPLNDWIVLAGHLQRIYVQLVTSVLAGHDHRPSLLKMVAMEPAIRRTHGVIWDAQNGRAPRLRHRSFIVMQNWDPDPKKAVPQIREFIQAHAAGSQCTVKVDPQDVDLYVVKPKGLPGLAFTRQDYLAVDKTSGELVSFTEDEYRQLDS